MSPMPPHLVSLANVHAKDWNVLWAWGATVDYRFEVPRNSRWERSLLKGSGDEELRIAPAEFEPKVERLRRSLGGEPNVRPGGSPFISAWALSQLGGWNAGTQVPTSRFVGIYPPALSGVLPNGTPPALLEHAIPLPSIKGTIALEHHGTSRKRMYSVFAGRKLTSQLATSMEHHIDAALDSIGRDGRVILAIGGLNKADPCRLLHMVNAFRRRRPDGIVFVGTNSFAPILKRRDRDEAMANYLQLLRAAHVVSLSAEEVEQVGAWLGVDVSKGLYPSLRKLDLPGLTICHHRLGCALTMSRSVAARIEDGYANQIVRHAAAGVAQYMRTGRTDLSTTGDVFPEEDQVSANLFRKEFGISPWHADAVPIPQMHIEGTSAPITGMGARFDGYLSGLLPLVGVAF